MGPLIHPTAVVEAGAEVHDGVEVGPFAVIGRHVILGPGTRVLSHAVLSGHLRMGSDNIFYPFSAVGGPPQGQDDPDAHAALWLGDHNVVREHVTIHGGTEGGKTVIGSHNLLMAGCHIAHDVTVGSHCVIANAVQIAGHGIIDDYVTFGGLSGIAQFVKVGESAFVTAGAMCERDVPPFVVVQGDRARIRSINLVGLRRRAIPKASIAALQRALRTLFASANSFEERLRAVESTDPYVTKLVESLTRRTEKAHKRISVIKQIT